MVREGTISFRIRNYFFDVAGTGRESNKNGKNEGLPSTIG